MFLSLASVCTFEDQTLCGWTQVQSDDFDWRVRDGNEVDTFGGPVFDHTATNPPGKVEEQHYEPHPKINQFKITNYL